VTPYTVVWRDEALNELASIWVKAPVRNEITIAVDLIDAELSEDPASKGKAMLIGLLKYVAPPLQVLYEVENDERLARVLAVALL
jgi:hypothetical protein